MRSLMYNASPRVTFHLQADILSHSMTYCHTRWHTATLDDILPHSMTYGHTRWHTVTLDDILSHSMTYCHTRHQTATVCHETNDERHLLAQSALCSVVNSGKGMYT